MIDSTIYLLDINSLSAISGKVQDKSSSELSLIVDRQKITLIESIYNKGFLWDKENDIIYMSFSSISDMNREKEHILSNPDYRLYIFGLIDAIREENKISKFYKNYLKNNSK